MKKHLVTLQRKESNLPRHCDYLLELYYPSEARYPVMIYSLLM